MSLLLPFVYVQSTFSVYILTVQCLSFIVHSSVSLSVSVYHASRVYQLGINLVSHLRRNRTASSIFQLSDIEGSTAILLCSSETNHVQCERKCPQCQVCSVSGVFRMHMPCSSVEHSCCFRVNIFMSCQSVNQMFQYCVVCLSPPLTPPSQPPLSPPPLTCSSSKSSSSLVVGKRARAAR